MMGGDSCAHHRTIEGPFREVQICQAQFIVGSLEVVWQDVPVVGHGEVGCGGIAGVVGVVQMCWRRAGARARGR